jgi:hypothetical protein
VKNCYCDVSGRVAFRNHAPQCLGCTRHMKATAVLSITSESKRKPVSEYRPTYVSILKIYNLVPDVTPKMFLGHICGSTLIYICISDIITLHTRNVFCFQELVFKFHDHWGNKSSWRNVAKGMGITVKNNLQCQHKDTYISVRNLVQHIMLCYISKG